MTFSIVGQAGDGFGIAVASKFLAAGSVVPMARLGVGAVASQALANMAWRGQALDLVAAGSDAASAVDELRAADANVADRQIGLVTATSQSTFTGAECMSWAGGRSGRDDGGGYAIQGNILVGEQVVLDAERAWLDGAHLPLMNRLVSALQAGDRAGGDRRGRQSAAVYAVQPDAGYDHSGVLVDLRVDDHLDPVNELARQVDLWDLYFGAPTTVLPLDGALRAEVGEMLARAGRTSSDVEAALADWAGEVNLEMRLTPDGIDARMLQMLRESTADRGWQGAEGAGRSMPTPDLAGPRRTATPGLG